jgi:hypothetical protein
MIDNGSPGINAPGSAMNGYRDWFVEHKIVGHKNAGNTTSYSLGLGGCAFSLLSAKGFSGFNGREQAIAV